MIIKNSDLKEHAVAIGKFITILLGDTPPHGYFKTWIKNTKQTQEFRLPDERQKIKETVDHLKQAGEEIYYMPCLHQDQTGPAGRGKADGVIVVPGFWMDIDIAGDGHKQSKLPKDIDAALDIINDIPLKPTMIVHSGGGLHVYWLFEKPWILTSPDENKKAQALSKEFQGIIQAVARKKGYKLDNTADLARVLRLPATYNYKNGQRKEVQVIYLDPENRHKRNDVEKFIKENIDNAQANNHKVSPVPLSLKDFNQNINNDVQVFNPTADLEVIKDKCAWFKHCIDDAANLPEPEWFKMINIGCHCINGQALIHEWSKPYPGYSYQETETKIQHALGNGYGPHTCETIRNDCNGAEYCDSCPHRGKIKSPIVLGLPDTLQDEQIKSIAILDASFDDNILIPPSYIISRDQDVQKFVKSKNTEDKTGLDELDNYKLETIIPIPVIIIRRLVNTISNEEKLEIAWFRDGDWKTLVIERKCLFVSRYIDALVKLGIPMSSNNSHLVIAFFQEFERFNIDRLPVSLGTENLGWQNGLQTFLIGEKAFFINDGDVKPIHFIGTGDGAIQLADGFRSKGSYQTWISVINRLYVHPPVMAMVFASFISPLLEILDINGFTVDLAYETSKGKTITLRVAASVWGNPNESAVDSILYA